MNVPIDQYKGWNDYLRYIENDKLVHRCVLEKRLGRKIRWNHEAHHVDLEKLNNDALNIAEANHMQHMVIHQIEDECPEWILLRSLVEVERISKGPNGFLEECVYITMAAHLGVDIRTIMQPCIDAEEALLDQSILVIC